MTNPIPKNNAPDKALVEALNLLGELLDGPSRGEFYGIDGALRSKLETIRLTLKRSISQPQHGGLAEADIRKAVDAAFSELPKERWSCSDDASGTALTLARQRHWSASAVRAALASNSPVVGEDGVVPCPVCKDADDAPYCHVCCGCGHLTSKEAAIWLRAIYLTTDAFCEDNGDKDRENSVETPTDTSEEYMTVTLSKDGTVTSHNSYDADFDEMVLATQKIVAALQERLDGRSRCPFSHGANLRKGGLPTDTADTPPSALREAIDQLSGIVSPSAGVLRIEQAEALSLLIRHARVTANDTPPASELVGTWRSVAAWLREKAATSGYDHNLSGNQAAKWADLIDQHAAALTTAPTAPVDREDELTDAIRAAYIAGAEAVHNHWVDEERPEFDGDFTEAAHDYSASVDIASLLPKIPDGWVAVPREPTEAMIRAAGVPDDRFATAIWSAVLSALPEPPVSVKEGV